MFEYRRTEVQNKLATEHCSEEKKKRQLLNYGRKESQYLRLRRTRLGLEDFITVKVIGKGAFGEVSSSQRSSAEIFTYYIYLGSLSSSRRYRKDLCNEDFKKE